MSAGRWVTLGAAVAAVGVYLAARPARTPVLPLARCRPYAEFAAALKSGAESDAELAADAACLCGLAGGFDVHNSGRGIQPYFVVKSCPPGSVPRPLEPDAKQWMGQWIEDPGHHACACYPTIRAERVVSVAAGH